MSTPDVGVATERDSSKRPKLTGRRRRIPAVVVSGVVLIGLGWLITDNRTIGWTGVALASPVFGPVEVRDDASHVVARANLHDTPSPGQQERFEIGPGHYRVVVCAGVTQFQQTYSVWVLPAFHTTVWNEPQAFASAFIALCSH